MNVLIVNMSLSRVSGGGTVERTFQLSRFFARSGIGCKVLTSDMGLTPELIKDLHGVDVHALKTVSKRFYLPKFSLKRIRSLIQDVDIIQLMNHWTFLNALVYSIARRFQKPYVICPAGSLPIFGRSKLLKKIYNQIIGNKIIRNASGCIVISPDEFGFFQKIGLGDDKIVHIPNGVNVEDFRESDARVFREKAGIGNAPFILFLGRLDSIKGPDLLLQAFFNLSQQFSHYHLVFAGPDAGMLSKLKKSVSETGMGNRVHFYGYIGNEEKFTAYQEADLLVIPSRREAMSIVVLEAGIAKTPVLLTDRCGFNVVGSINGGKVVSASIDGLQDGLLELLSDPDSLKMMGVRLGKYVNDNFTWQKIGQKHIEFFKAILAKAE